MDVTNVIRRMGRRVSDGQTKADNLQTWTIFMLFVTWANLGEFSQRCKKVYCSDWSKWPIFCTDSLLKKRWWLTEAHG